MTPRITVAEIMDALTPAQLKWVGSAHVAAVLEAIGKVIHSHLES